MINLTRYVLARLPQLRTPLPVRPPNASFPTALNGFPNYFYTDDEAKLQATQGKIESALASMVRRLEVHHIDPISQKIATDGFFPKIEERVLSYDPDAKAYVSGGVVRSMLGYIYKEVYDEHQRHSDERATNEALTRIILGETGPLAKLTALGIGSDIDVLIDFSNRCPEEQRGEIRRRIVEFMNAFGKDLADSAMKRSLVAVADVKEYKPQTARSSRQGGSPLDWLAFPISPKSGTGIRLPEGYPFIMRDFVQGVINYMPVDSVEGEESRQQTIIRQLRLPLEIPFLQPSTQSRKIFLQSFRDLTAKAKQGELDRKVMAQFQKAVLNTYFPEACNYFAVPDKTDTELQKLVRGLSRAAMGLKNLPAIPEFLPKTNIENRADDFDPGSFKALGLLMPHEEFIRKHTDDGTLYHGTPSIEGFLGMIRCGLVVSTQQEDRKQGNAMHGRGFYTTKCRKEAEHYAEQTGFVLSFPVITSPKLRVIDLNTLSPKYLKQLSKEAEKQGIDFHEHLATHYSIDVIVNEYVLLQNAGAIVLPKTAENVVKAFQDPCLAALKTALLTKQPSDILQCARAIHTYSPYRKEPWSFFLPNQDAFIREALLAFLQDADIAVNKAGVETLLAIDSEILCSIDPQHDPKLRRALAETIVKLLNHEDDKEKLSAIEAMLMHGNNSGWHWLGDQIKNALFKLLNSTDPKILSQAMHWVRYLDLTQREISRQLLKIYRNKDALEQPTRLTALEILNKHWYEFTVQIDAETADQIFQEIVDKTPYAPAAQGFLERLVCNPTQKAVIATLQRAIDEEKDPAYVKAVQIVNRFNNETPISQICQVINPNDSLRKQQLHRLKTIPGPLALAVSNFIARSLKMPGVFRLVPLDGEMVQAPDALHAVFHTGLQLLRKMIATGELRASNAAAFIDKFNALLSTGQPIAFRKQALLIAQDAHSGSTYEYLQSMLSEKYDPSLNCDHLRGVGYITQNLDRLGLMEEGGYLIRGNGDLEAFRRAVPLLTSLLQEKGAHIPIGTIVGMLLAAETSRAAHLKNSPKQTTKNYIDLMTIFRQILRLRETEIYEWVKTQREDLSLLYKGYAYFVQNLDEIMFAIDSNLDLPKHCLPTS